MDAHLDTQSDHVHDLLGEIVDIVVGNGAHVRPGFVICERDGGLSAHFHGDDGEEALLRVPRELLVPVTGVAWTSDRDALRMSGEPEGLTRVQRELLDLHIELYNACHKVPEVAATHPRMASSVDLVQAIKQVRPRFEVATSAAELFITTRVLGVRDSDETRVPSLMPLIDVLNHHPDAPPFRMQSAGMQVATSRPNGGTQCYVHYGRARDVLDLALNYGYLDTATRYVRCPPLSIGVPGLGTLDIAGRHSRRPKELPTPAIELTDEGVTLSHILFQPSRQRWQTPLKMAVSAAVRQRGGTQAAAEAAADETAQLLIEEATRMLSDLATAAEKAPQGALVAQAASHQVSQLRAFA